MSQPPQEALRAALVQDDVRAVEKIIQAHPELVEEEMFTAEQRPLHWAAQNAGPEVIQLLLDRGAELHSQDRNGETPLHLVAQRRGLKKEDAAHLAGLLIRAGADVHARDAQGETPLHEAAGWNNPAVAEILPENGAQANVRDDSNRTPLGAGCKPAVAAVIQQHGGSEDTEKDLLEAVRSGNVERVRSLLDNDPNLAVDPRTRDGMEFTPLHLAVAMKNPEMVAVLLAHGADPDAKNRQGRTARDFAGRGGGFGEPVEQKKIRELFKEHPRDRSKS
jgi:ankyrin repeat protein